MYVVESKLKKEGEIKTKKMQKQWRKLLKYDNTFKRNSY